MINFNIPSYNNIRRYLRSKVIRSKVTTLDIPSKVWIIDNIYILCLYIRDEDRLTIILCI